MTKTGPKPKPESEHYRRLTITLPPELYKDLIAYIQTQKGKSVSGVTAELIEYALIEFVF